MNESTFRRRGWVCAAMAPAACVLFLLGQWAGLWEPGGSPVFTVLAAVLIMEMLAGTVAPFWWMLTYFRRRNQMQGSLRAVLYANVFALLVSILFFF